MNGGKIRIDTELATDKFDRQIDALDRKIQQEENKKIEINAQIADVQKQLSNYDELKKKAEDYRWELEKLEKMPAQAKEMGMTLKTSEYLNRLSQARINYALISSELQQEAQAVEAVNARMSELNRKQQSINDEISYYKQKIESIKLQKHVSEVDAMKNSFSSVGNSVQSTINKVAKLALGIFGVRSAYMALRRASSELASYDAQYASNINYIRFALTQLIAPVLRWIVSMVATILGYINAIINALFGVNLFAKLGAGAKDFQKMKGGASGTAKAVKEISKQLAGFDEMNVLTDNSSGGGGGGGGGGATMPNFDLSALSAKQPAWLEWLVNNKDLILALMAGISAGLLAWKLGLSAILSLGIGVLVAGIVYAVQALVAYIKDPTWANFGKLITGIGTAIAGLGIIIAKVAGIAVGLPVIVAGVVIAIVGIIIKHWDTIQAYLQKGIDWLSEKSNWVREHLGNTIGNIYDLFVKIIQKILDWFDLTFKSLKGVLDGIIQFFKGVFTGQWSMAWEGIKKIVSNVWTWIKETIKTAFNVVVNAIDIGINAIKGFFNLMWTGIKAGASVAFDGIKAVFSGIVGWFGGIINSVIGKFREMGSLAGEVIGGAFRAVVNGVLRVIENVLNTPIRAINGLINTINAVPRNKFKQIKYI